MSTWVYLAQFSLFCWDMCFSPMPWHVKTSLGYTISINFLKKFAVTHMVDEFLFQKPFQVFHGWFRDFYLCICFLGVSSPPCWWPLFPLVFQEPAKGSAAPSHSGAENRGKTPKWKTLIKMGMIWGLPLFFLETSIWSKHNFVHGESCWFSGEMMKNGGQEVNKSWMYKVKDSESIWRMLCV